MPIGLACAGLAGAQTQVQIKAPTDTPPPTTFPVSMTVNVTVNTTHPMARRWGLQCGAIIGAPASVSLVIEGINTTRNAFQLSSTMPTEQNSYDKFSQTILSPAHYYGAEGVIGGELRNGAYTGNHTVTVNVPVTQLIDPATKSVYAQPVALVGCWITINERPAVRARGNLLAGKDNVNYVSMNYIPYFTELALVKSASP